jgi:predicted regulator of Ras-like GTPase activity (Roadblock/LC7/MglB family)
MESHSHGEESVNLFSQEIDGLPFVEALEKTAEIKWCGILRVLKEDEQIGSVFMRDGQIAWAVSKNQTENFSSFLERIGLIPKEKLSEIVSKYKALGKAKKLGALLEEEGLISHEKLRECLRAHIRAAITSMMNDPEVVINASHGEMIVDTNLLFLLNEVLPNYYHEEEPVDIETVEAFFPRNEYKAHNTEKIIDILGNLAMLPGYQYSFISEPDGKLLALHKSDADANSEPAADAAIAWINSSLKSANGLFGDMECIILEHGKGSLIAQMANGEKHYFVTVSCDKDGKLGVIKHKISDLLPSIREFMI